MCISSAYQKFAYCMKNIGGYEQTLNQVAEEKKKIGGGYNGATVSAEAESKAATAVVQKIRVNDEDKRPCIEAFRASTGLLQPGTSDSGYDIVVNCEKSPSAQRYVAVSLDDAAPFFTNECPIADHIIALPANLIGSKHKLTVVFMTSDEASTQNQNQFSYSFRSKTAGHIIDHVVKNSFVNCGGNGRAEKTNAGLYTCAFKDEIQMMYSPPK